ncbi:2OG-Fe(II) oxygenase [Alkalimarinus alittae]|uniref:2OG-Fe(II) oxygenase n=1 Tax=Alkalimarinus alittae TaxID=2961619 RepID=A0ABY6N1S8_9ALTE|nr:2OG-Fe(II) oxygenase [Alkalimarinus alittae]UZE96031.1 2OG-Fe(II) oxygenase [Alkalimarinus alittae]
MTAINPPCLAFPVAVVNTVIDALVEKGYVIIDDFLPQELTQALRNEIIVLNGKGIDRAGIGRGGQLQVNTNIRSDKIHWLNGSTDAQRCYLAQCDALRRDVNRDLFMGLNDYESHFAVYEPSSFYKKHLDAFKGRSNRVLTSVIYLNETWEDGWGGELVVYDETDQVIERVLPKGGRAIFFLSERFPHEVLITQQQRLSIAGWYRINSSTANYVDPAH